MIELNTIRQKYRSACVSTAKHCLAGALLVLISSCRNRSERPAISLLESESTSLPAGFTATGAAFRGSTGSVAWSAKWLGITRVDTGAASPVVTVSGPPILLVTETADNSLQIFRASGEVQELTPGGEVRQIRLVPLAKHLGSTGVANIGGVRWFLRQDSSGVSFTNGEDSYHWDFRGSELLVSAVDDGIVAQEFAAPHRLFRAYLPKNATTVRVMWRSTGLTSFAEPSEWRGLRPLALGKGIVLQSFANLVTDSRLLALVDSLGHTLTTVRVPQAFAFQDVDTARHRLLGVRQNGRLSSVFVMKYVLQVP